MDALIGAIVGGVLVVLADVARRRWERRHYLDQQLLQQASELMSHEWTRESAAKVLRADPSEAAREELQRLMSSTGIRERRLAAAHLWLLPGRSVGPAARDFMSATNALADAALLSEPEWELHLKVFREARRKFEQAIKHSLGDG